MPSTEYVRIDDPGLESRVRSRYSKDIEALARLGFRTLCTCVEQLGPYSAILRLPMMLLMLGFREVLLIRPRLRLAAGFLLMTHPDPPTIALPMGMGVKFYSGFSDGSVLITTTFQSYAVPLPASPIEKQVVLLGGSPGAWRGHRERVNALVAGGKVLETRLTFDAYVDVSRREEEPSAYRLNVG